jgi:D-psicose/D-tagatose/L-ribulose 3-epimerase
LSPGPLILVLSRHECCDGLLGSQRQRQIRPPEDGEMKIGANTMIWASDFAHEHLPLIDKIAAMGFDVIEVLVSSREPNFEAKQVRKRIRDAGMKCSVSASLAPDNDISSADEEVRRRGVGFLESVVATAEAIGATVVAGPLYAKIGRLKFLSSDARAAELDRSSAALRHVAKTAENRGVDLALEVLNRFESDFLNIAEHAVPFVESIGSKAVGIHLDTFHMSIEEKNVGAAIRRAGPHLKHMHMSENDRGTPGQGQVHWSEVRQALIDVNYDGFLVIEAFNPTLPDLAEFVRIWRPVALSQDALASDGLRFLRGLMG